MGKHTRAHSSECPLDAHNMKSRCRASWSMRQTLATFFQYTASNYYLEMVECEKVMTCALGGATPGKTPRSLRQAPPIRPHRKAIRRPPQGGPQGGRSNHHPVPETVEHFLLECRRYTTYRHDLRTTIGGPLQPSNLLGNRVNVHKAAKYARDTGILDPHVEHEGA